MAHESFEVTYLQNYFTSTEAAHRGTKYVSPVYLYSITLKDLPDFLLSHASHIAFLFKGFFSVKYNSTINCFSQ